VSETVVLTQSGNLFHVRQRCAVCRTELNLANRDSFLTLDGQVVCRLCAGKSSMQDIRRETILKTKTEE